MIQFRRTIIKLRLLSELTTIDFWVWSLLATLPLIRPIIVMYEHNIPATGNGRLFIVLLDFYPNIMLAILLATFPMLFKFIFLKYPIEYLRSVRAKRILKEVISMSEQDNTLADEYDEVISRRSSSHSVYTQDKHVLYSHLEKSEKISEKIFSRSNAYLLIGCLIAFTGVFFFYVQTSSIGESNGHYVDNITKLMIYFPRIGSLIFVEAIAFFFLRQYRQTMEEFRYYEAIQRQRENQYAIFKLAEDFKDKSDEFDKLITYCSFHTNPNKLAQGETSSILEAEKAQGKDLEIFDKLIELVKASKK